MSKIVIGKNNWKIAFWILNFFFFLDINLNHYRFYFLGKAIEAIRAEPKKIIRKKKKWKRIDIKSGVFLRSSSGFISRPTTLKNSDQHCWVPRNQPQISNRVDIGVVVKGLEAKCTGRKKNLWLLPNISTYIFKNRIWSKVKFWFQDEAR